MRKLTDKQEKGEYLNWVNNLIVTHPKLVLSFVIILAMPSMAYAFEKIRKYNFPFSKKKKSNDARIFRTKAGQDVKAFNSGGGSSDLRQVEAGRDAIAEVSEAGQERDTLLPGSPNTGQKVSSASGVAGRDLQSYYGMANNGIVNKIIAANSWQDGGHTLYANTVHFYGPRAFSGFANVGPQYGSHFEEKPAGLTGNLPSQYGPQLGNLFNNHAEKRFFWPDPSHSSAAVKRRDNLFVGREEQLRQLAHFLSNNTGRFHQTLQVLVFGVSGIGKSALVREYMVKAYEKKLKDSYGCDLEYDCIIYIEPPLQENLKSLIDQLRIGSVDFADSVKNLYRYLHKKYNQILFIYDDFFISKATRHEDLFPKLPYENLHIIITSTVLFDKPGNIFSPNLTMRVHPFTDEEVCEFMKMNCGDKKLVEPINLEWSRSLGNIPIAVEMAFNCHQRSGVSLSKAAELFSTEILNDKHKKIYNHWFQAIDLASQKIKEKIGAGPYEVNVLIRYFSVLAYLDNIDIGLDYIVNLLEISEKNMVNINQVLSDCALIYFNLESNALGLHPLMQRTFRQWLNKYYNNDKRVLSFFSDLSEKVSEPFLSDILHFHPKTWETRFQELRHFKRIIQAGYQFFMPDEFSQDHHITFFLTWIKMNIKLAKYQGSVLRDKKTAFENTSQSLKIIEKIKKEAGDILSLDNFNELIILEVNAYYTDASNLLAHEPLNLTERAYRLEKAIDLIKGIKDSPRGRYWYHHVQHSLSISDGMLGDFDSMLLRVEEANRYFIQESGTSLIKNPFISTDTNVLMGVVNIAIAKMGKRDFKQGIEYSKPIYENGSRGRLECYPLLIWNACILGMLTLREKGRSREVLDYFRYAIKLSNETYNSETCYKCRNYVSPALKWIECLDTSSLGFYKELYELTSRFFGEDHYANIEYAYYYARALGNNNKFDRAISIYEQSIEALNKGFLLSDPNLLEKFKILCAELKTTKAKKVRHFRKNTAFRILGGFFTLSSIGGIAFLANSRFKTDSHNDIKSLKKP